MALQTKTFTYGGLHNTGSRYFRTELCLTEKSVDAQQNSSLLGYCLTLYAGNTRLSQWRTGARIFLNGTEYVHRDGTDYANQITISDQESLILCEGELTVPHKADGTCDLSVAFSLYHPVTASYTPGNFTYTGGSMTLTPIPMADTVRATDAFLGSVSMVAIGQKKQGRTHALAYEIGNLSGYVTEDGICSDREERFSALSIPFSLPERFYEAIPESKTGLCRLTCHTYEGETPVGTSQTQFTVMTRAEDCAPSLIPTVTDGNEKTVALTGDSSVLVRFASRADCTLIPTAQKGAWVTQCRIGDVEGERLSIENAEQDTYSFGVTDSRGYDVLTVVKTPFVPYVKLTAHPCVTRPDPTSGLVNLSVRGSCFVGSFGAGENSLSLLCTLPDGREVTLTPVFDGEDYQAETVLEGIDPNSVQRITLTAADALMTVTEQVAIPKGTPVFCWGEQAFSVNVPANINGVHMAAASENPLRVFAPAGVLVCGSGVLGVASEDGWIGTEGIAHTVQDGDICLTLPQGTGQVLFLSPGEFTIRK